MSAIQVLLVAGTHGNEINPIWLFEQWEKLSILINTYGIETHKVIGNPMAYKAGKRYINNDLNRSFIKESFLKDNHQASVSVDPIKKNVYFITTAGEVYSLNYKKYVLDLHT